MTGASSGVGRAVALELVRRGARVLATARRGDRLAALAAESSALVPGALHPEAGDITAPMFRRHVVEMALRKHGRLDLIVAAAGGGAIGRFADSVPETLARIMAVDFEAPAELVRESLPRLLAAPDPAIVLVGSILGYHPLPLHAEYCAAKAALRSLAGALRLELAADGVDVVLASLGPTASEFWDHLLTGSRPAWSRGRAMPAAGAARAIVDAVERRRPEVLPGLAAKGYALASRLFPGLIDGVMARNLRGSRTASRTRSP